MRAESLNLRQETIDLVRSAIAELRLVESDVKRNYRDRAVQHAENGAADAQRALELVKAYKHTGDELP